MAGRLTEVLEAIWAASALPQAERWRLCHWAVGPAGRPAPAQDGRAEKWCIDAVSAIAKEDARNANQDELHAGATKARLNGRRKKNEKAYEHVDTESIGFQSTEFSVDEVDGGHFKGPEMFCLHSEDELRLDTKSEPKREELGPASLAMDPYEALNGIAARIHKPLEKQEPEVKAPAKKDSEPDLVMDPPG